MRQYETFELVYEGPVLANEYARVDVTAEFCCEDETKVVKGFYDGDGRYVVRFLPEKTGNYTWHVSGVVDGCGEAFCDPAGEGHHGIVKAVETHFECEDGTLFTPFGTTVYALASQEDALVEETLESLKNAPFNKVRMCVFPKHYDYNHNEPPYYAFEKKEDGSWDVGRPNLQFWHRFEAILHRIAAMDIQIDLILFHPYDRWGFARLPQQDNLKYLDYLLRRLSAMPNIWWSLANEYDLNLASKSMRDWEEIEEYVAANDPYGHPLSNHNCMAFWDASRPAITHASYQTKALTEIARWIEKYQKPLIIDECCYEGNLQHFWGSISGREMVYRFWRCYASGAYCTHGETFLSDDEILWWARGGKLKGESPKRIAFLREIIESLPGALTPIQNGLVKLALATPEQLEEMLKVLPEEMRGFVQTFGNSLQMMNETERLIHLSGEHEWTAQVKEEAYLWFNDKQCYAIQDLRLPEDKKYRIEMIDVWEMTREVIEEEVTGPTRIHLPGREGLAVLATRIG
ncbi:MAG: DUF5060 domain-containing protein [Lachnospiraceae bacterium]|nr:DUF5060 domain-containing protein [Lachnospiraceae bacterium]